MKKQTISVILCLAILLSIVSICFTANAVTVNKESTKANVDQSSAGVSKITSADDFSWDNSTVYFLLTDRFKNGDTSNDHSYGRATDADGNPLPGWDTAPGTFHGGDFAGITQEIESGYFDDLGVNAIWLSAPYEQIHGYVDSGVGFAHYSYHGYYVLDYTEADANFGTKEEFQTLVDTAHKHGIRIVMDIVMNHSGYNTIADMEEYGYGTLLPGALDFKYKLDSVSALNDHIDFKTSETDWGKWWGPDWVRSGLPGYSEGSGGDLQMSLAGLPDFRTEATKSVSIPPILETKWTKEGTYNEKVAKYGSSDTVSNYIVKWLSEWVSQYGVDGFRCDTAKHVELGSWKKLKDSCVKALKTWRSNNPGKPGADWDEDFWMTGEHWDHKVGYDGYYSEGGFDSMINFDSSGTCLPGASAINGKYQNYASTINTRDDFNVLTYISSHDSALARCDDMIYQGSAFLLLPGGIQIFYGDETNRKTVPGMSFDGHGGSGHSLRSDMNWDSIDKEELAHWQKVGQFRNRHVAVGAGDHQQITAYNGSTGYTFSRSYDDGTVADNIIATIGAPKNTDIAVNVSSVWSDGSTVTNFYDGTTTTVEGGKAVFNSGANGTILIEGPISTINMSLKGKYSFYDSQVLTVSLRGADFAMVSVNGGTPFRVVDGDTFTVGEDIELGAEFTVTITASNDEETSNKSYTYKKKDPAAVTRIYFDNSQYQWNKVNAYIYDESGSNTLENSAWPGEAMEYDLKTGYYLMEVPEGLEEGRVIFNAGKSSPNRYPADAAPGLEINGKSMIFSYGNKWESYNGSTIPTTTQKPYDPADYTTIYFDNSSTNFSTPYVYYWVGSTNSGEVSWPGVAMTKYDGDIWTATFPKENDKCIFSNQGGNQTRDQQIPGTNQIFRNGNWEAYNATATTTTTSTTSTTSATSPTTATTSPIVVGTLGDANGDSDIDIRDVTTVQKYSSGETVTINLDNADVNKDGEVNIRDATLIQKFISKNISGF